MRLKEGKVDSVQQGHIKRMELIAQGAEAKIFLDNGVVTKERFEKSYRHPMIDHRLRQFRTRRESKVLQKLSEAQFPCPQFIEMNDKDMNVKMELLPGERVRDVFDENFAAHSKEIGKLVAELHNLGIIHHDLTTSNMIFHSEKKKIFFIDFGLSFFSEKHEDKAVDLHLLRRALESRHYKVFDKAFSIIIDSYKKNSLEGEATLQRLKLVEKRGRNKAKH